MVVEELIKQVDSLTKQELEELFNHIRWLLSEKEPMTEDEKIRFDQGVEEINRGQYTDFDDV
ncbi:MAG: hypothetical protein NTX88_09325 [Candidatus Atribacteria bacterium]|nr:hypothetical protein [Candidatus Atribacteria bacterium]